MHVARKTTVGLALGLAAWLYGDGPAMGLEPGDQAPPLEVARWIKGQAVDLADSKGRSVLVVEFWATWCRRSVAAIPTCTSLQKKYEKDGVVFLGISDEDAEIVQAFVEKRGGEIGYRVAVDDQGKTYRAYMGGAGVPGIPHAFIVDRAGRLAWHGHPLDDMDEVLQRVVAGDHQAAPLQGGRSTAPHAEKLPTDRELMQRLDRAYNLEDWEAALGHLDALIERNAEDARFKMIKLHLLAVVMQDNRRATAWGMELVEDHREDADFLNELSWRLLTTAEYGSRCTQVAYEAAAAAYRASEGERSDISDTLARALYQVGRIDQAIRLQEKAILLATEGDADEAGVQEMEEILRYYRDCAAVRAGAMLIDE